MYSSVLSVLFLGMLPVTSAQIGEQMVTLRDVGIAPPAEVLTIRQRLSASGVLVMDMESGQRMYGYQEDIQRPMGSLTKLMTALIIVENHELDEWVQIPDGISNVEGKKAYLPDGYHFTVADLLSVLLIGSANDAAQVLAIYHSGSVSAFVEEMNQRTAALGLRETSYANPTGLDASGQVSTPQDIAWLTMFIMRYPEIRERMGMSQVRIRSREGYAIHMMHTHALLHADTAVRAGKTGTTDGAGQCLVSVVEEGGREYLVVLLNSLQRYSDMKEILHSLSPSVVSARLDM